MRALIGLTLALWYAHLSWVRTPVFQSERALWTEAVRLGPETPRPWIRWAETYWVPWYATPGTSADRMTGLYGFGQAYRAARLPTTPWLDQHRFGITAAQALGVGASTMGDGTAAAIYFDQADRWQEEWAVCVRTPGCPISRSAAR